MIISELAWLPCCRPRVGRRRAASCQRGVRALLDAINHASFRHSRDGCLESATLLDLPALHPSVPARRRVPRSRTPPTPGFPRKAIGENAIALADERVADVKRGARWTGQSDRAPIHGEGGLALSSDRHAFARCVGASTHSAAIALPCVLRGPRAPQLRFPLDATTACELNLVARRLDLRLRARGPTQAPHGVAHISARRGMATPSLRCGVPKLSTVALPCVDDEHLTGAMKTTVAQAHRHLGMAQCAGPVSRGNSDTMKSLRRAPRQKRVPREDHGGPAA